MKIAITRLNLGFLAFTLLAYCISGLILPLGIIPPILAGITGVLILIGR